MNVKICPEIYETPEIIMLEFEVEAGIASSGEPGKAPVLKYTQEDDIYL